MAVICVVMLGLGALLDDAQAKRIGGGRSVGKQSSGVSQREAAPPSAAPTTGAAPAQAPQSQAAAPARGGQVGQAPATSGARRWLAPLAGIAAGLGLAALAHSLGLGEEFGTIMMMALLAIVVLFVLRRVFARRSPSPADARALGGARNDMAYQGVGQEASVPAYSPAPQVGSVFPEPVRPSASALSEPRGLRIPEGFDVEGFVRQAKSQYARLQAAFDAGDLAVLQEFTSPEMLAQLRQDIEGRQGSAHRTDVVTLDAELLGIEQDGGEYVASVRFHGMVRESEGAAAERFDEVWNLVKPIAGGQGWVLAGVQQLN